MQEVVLGGHSYVLAAGELLAPTVYYDVCPAQAAAVHEFGRD